MNKKQKENTVVRKISLGKSLIFFLINKALKKRGLRIGVLNFGTSQKRQKHKGHVKRYCNGLVKVVKAT